MGCVESKYNLRDKKLGPFKELQLKLLRMMYQDIAVRSPQQLMTKENFYIFFHINGLWGHEIFTRFDKNNSGELDFDEFKNGVEQLVKGSFRKKVKALFDFYDIDRSGSISFTELLKMLYSYPKEELTEMFKDNKFIDSMGKQDQEYMLKDENMTKPILEVEEASQDQSKIDRRRRNSEQINNYVYVMTPQPFVNSENHKERSSFGGFAATNPFQFTNGHESANPRLISGRTTIGIERQSKSPHRSPLFRGGSTLVGEQMALTKKKIKISSNISLLVKKYASFLFGEEGLDIHKDKLNVQQFGKLIQGHEKIFASYFEGFHNYIWEVENGDNIPEFIINTSWVKESCIEIYEKQNYEESRYIRFYKNTIFVFKRESSTIPEQIKNMEGLYVEEYNIDRRHLYGFIVKHRDGVYPEKAYLFKEKEIQQQWMRHLKFFKRISVLEKYTFEEKIGSGNYSVVYKGIEKGTNQPVAIKSIQKFKLSVAERDVIQHECGILERCHHPCIVKFLEKSETKTHIYIITELMNEGDLDEYIKQKTFLDEYEASIIMKQLIQAMIYVNSLGLIHRDLKAENIMIRKRKDKDIVEKIKIIDFGFAVYKYSLKTMSNKEKYVGSQNYVAPEMLQMKEFNESVDNFSIGIIMYYMLCGNLPFDAVLQEEVNRLTVECNISLDNAHWSNVSDNAKDLMMHLIIAKQSRISLAEALKHPWIVEFKDLKAMIGRNKRGGRYI